MSIGLRLLLLIVLALGAVWVSRRRSDELTYWFHAPAALQASDPTQERPPRGVEGVITDSVDLDLAPPAFSELPQAIEEPLPHELDARWDRIEEPSNPVILDPEFQPPSGSFEGEPEDWPLDPTPGPEPDTGAGGGEPAPPAPAPAPTPDAEPTTREYVVVAGDSLRKIAKKELGEEARFREIVELNQDVLSGGETIFPDQVLRLPRE